MSTAAASVPLDPHRHFTDRVANLRGIVTQEERALLARPLG